MTALEDDQIRLVSVHRNDSHDHLMLSRQYVRYLGRQNKTTPNLNKPESDSSSQLNEAEPDYIALSYAWGTETDYVSCDNVEFRVSANLSPALRSLCRHFQGRLIWTDTLSIDQKNHAEKTYQIGLMGRIFSCAGTVAVWLGEDFGHLYKQLKQHAMQDPPDPEFRESRLSLLQAFSQCAWFYRAWTFQEIRLASNAIALFDDHVVPWSEFIQNLLTVQSFEPNVSTTVIRSLPMSQSKFASVRKDRFFEMLSELNSNKAHDLASLLYLTWYRDATEKHDKIYSLLGNELVTNSQHGIDVDYGVSWSTLCIKAARAAMNLGGNLKVLRIAGMMHRWKTAISNIWDPNELQHLLGHPSWAPDWWHPPQQPRSLSSLEYDRRGVFERLDFCCSLQPPVQPMDDGSPFLVLDGVFLGLINTSHDPTYHGGPTLIHPPPPCANLIQDVIADPSGELTIPKVETQFFGRALDDHLHGKCICATAHSRMPGNPRRQQFASPFASEKLHFNSSENFPLHSVAELTDLTEDKCPAQVLADSVESGDWLVLLQGGGVPFVIRPAKDPHGRLVRAEELIGFAHGGTLPFDAGVFVLVGEASMQWDKLWPGSWSSFCRAGTFILV